MHASKKSKQRVWDRPVRLLHWLLVLCVAGAWFTRERLDAWHQVFGYGALLIVVLRTAWGFAGSEYARFRQFVRGLSAGLAYLRQVRAGTAPRYLGHNPLGGWMVLALLSTVALLGVSGWALDTEMLWGYAWPVRLHAALGYGLLGLIGLHLAGVLFTSWQHRENLVAAMISGDKPD